jgi:4-hydroxybenzoyl-CoA thioesterase
MVNIGGLMYNYIYLYKVKWGDTDAAGIVYYPNFYKWMDQSTHELFGSLGFPSSKLFAEEKIGFPLLEAHCEFKSPALFEDTLRIVTSVKEIRNKVFKLVHEFYRGETLLANGYEVRAWTTFVLKKPKAVPIPENMRKLLEGSEVLVD